MFKNFKKYLNYIRESRECLEIVKRNSCNSQVIQRQLYFTYKQSKNQNCIPDFRETGFRVYSQNDEDGILLYIFALIGTTNKVCVDIAYASPYGANTTNLICNWDWNGLLICGSEKEAEFAKRFFNKHPDTRIVPPKVCQAWITAENINDIFKENNIQGEVDFLSLDIDGMDYWAWKSIEAINPRVVVTECQTFWGTEESVTAPYDPSFDRFKIHPEYFGASIPAFVKLAKEKGYRLVACNKFGFNTFFVRNDVGQDVLPEISIERCFENVTYDLKKNREDRLEQVKNLEWVEV